MVVHKASDRRISYGEIAAFAKVPAEMPKIEEKDLKTPADFRYIGKDVPRVEVPLKVTGGAKYGMDVQVPGMVYAAVLQSPYPGGAPDQVDDAAARKVPGVTDIVKLPGGVGVIGTTVEGTQAAQEPAQGHLDECARGEPRQRKGAGRVRCSRPRQEPRRCALREGRRRQGARWPRPRRSIRGEYRTRYVFHAQMEPINATASVSADGKSAEIWVGTQGPHRAP